MVYKETKRALESPSLGCSKTSKRSASGNCGTGVPLVVDYKPIPCRLGQVIRQNFCLSRSHLVRANVYPAGERLVGSRKCNKNRCRVCKNIETEISQSFVDKKVYKINHRLICSEKCLVYLLLCKVYGMQYNGQTNDEFRCR